MTDDLKQIGKKDGGFWGAVAIMSLFGLTFTGFGLMAFIMGIKGMQTAQKNAWVGVFVGGLFTLVGIGFDAGIVALFRVRKREAEVSAKFPGQPWMLDKGWASGTVPDDSKTSMIGAWIFAVLWNALSWPAFAAAMTKHDVGKMIFVIALFPLIGMCLLLAAIYVTARRMKFGRSSFQLETLPGRIGGSLAGTLRTAKVIDTSDGLKVVLKCVNSVTSGSGDNTTTNEYVLWQEEQVLGGRLPREGLGLALPIVFNIPATCSQTRPGGRNSISWKLIATAKEEGIDFNATFTVPVFEVDKPVAAKGSTPLEAQAARLRQAPCSPEESAIEAGIGLNKDAAGREHFAFPWTRNLKASMVLFILGGVFAVFGFGILSFDGAGFFAVVFLGIAALILFGALMWLRGRTISVLTDSVELRWTLFGFSRGRTVPRESIVNISYDTNSSVGGVAYYKVKLTTSDGQAIVAAGGRAANEAKWVTGELCRTLGLEDTSKI